MSHTSIRTLARQLDLSPATVSMALRKDPRVRTETTLRVQQAAEKAGYDVDPIMSEGLSRARRGTFYRETLAWCSDSPCPKKNQTWLRTLFEAAEEQGKVLGYSIEYFHFENLQPRTLARLCRMWKARGIRGVLLGPCDKELSQPPFVWNDLAWVAIGHSLTLPLLHRVRRDFEADIERAIARLTQKGSHRPGFLSEPESHHLFHTSLLRSALTYYHTSGETCSEPYIELPFNNTSRFRTWLKSMQIDSLIVSRPMPLLQSAASRKLPSIILSPDEQGAIPERCDGFIANYQAMGHASINLMHHLLMNRHLGIPELPQTMLTASPWHQFRSGPDK